jgi:hypothetical protein
MVAFARTAARPSRLPGTQRCADGDRRCRHHNNNGPAGSGGDDQVAGGYWQRPARGDWQDPVLFSDAKTRPSRRALLSSRQQRHRRAGPPLAGRATSLPLVKRWTTEGKDRRAGQATRTRRPLIDSTAKSIAAQRRPHNVGMAAGAQERRGPSRRRTRLRHNDIKISGAEGCHRLTRGLSSGLIRGSYQSSRWRRRRGCSIEGSEHQRCCRPLVSIETHDCRGDAGANLQAPRDHLHSMAKIAASVQHIS